VLAEKLTYRKRQHIVGVSAEVIKDYDTYIGLKGGSSVLYNYVDEKFFSLNYIPRQNATDLRLVAVGNLRRQKNYENLLQAFTLLKDYSVSLDIYGAGNLEETFRNFITTNNIRVTLKGLITDVASVLSAYDAYILSSLFEGYGIAPMEAMAAGMPVLLSDIPVLREVAGESPLYFDPLNPQSIADAIKEALQNRNQLIQRSAGNRSMVKEKASKEIYKQKLESIYRSVLSGNS
jgi:glycosyltransferase involved in cell wall biosynthesis